MTTTTLSPESTSVPVPAIDGAGASTAKRAGVLLYGVVVYAAFLAAFSYAIFFVGDFRSIVPTTLNAGGPAADVSSALLVNGLLLALFALQHAIMARPAFKRRWTKIVHPAIERSTFVLATSSILGLMYLTWRPMPDVIWSVGDGPLATVLTALSLTGWVLVLIATFLIDHFDLFGLKQTIRYARGGQHHDPAFRTPGLYRFVRHPIYLGFLIAFWAAPTMTAGHLLFAIGCTGFILVSSRLEERDLVTFHGDAYRRYRESVPALLPRLTPGR